MHNTSQSHVKQGGQQGELELPSNVQRGRVPQQLSLLESAAEGSSPKMATPKPRVAEPNKPRQTYKQNWSAYNQAQTNEVAEAQKVLYWLCGWIPEPTPGQGRPPARVRDLIAAGVMKVFTRMSGRRVTPLINDITTKGHIHHAPHYNTLSKYLAHDELTSILTELISESARPLRKYARVFAFDSSGFGICNSQRWGDVKWDHARIVHGKKVPNAIKRKDWVKLHAATDVVSNIITAAIVTDPFASDHKYFEPLFNKTREDFVIDEVVADKAYSSYRNLTLVASKAAIPYIPFTANRNPQKNSPATWKRMYNLWIQDPERFLAHYHSRSNVEATFSMIKRKFGEQVRSKKWPATANEVLLKVLCHNICCLIQAKYELGISLLPEVNL